MTCDQWNVVLVRCHCGSQRTGIDISDQVFCLYGKLKSNEVYWRTIRRKQKFTDPQLITSG